MVWRTPPASFAVLSLEMKKGTLTSALGTTGHGRPHRTRSASVAVGCRGTSRERPVPRLPDRKQSLTKVGVQSSLQTDRFTHSQARHGEKAEDGLMRRGCSGGWIRLGGFQQAPDVGVGPQVEGRAAGRRSKNIGRRHLSFWVDRLEVGQNREPRKADVPSDWLHTLGQSGPRYR